MTIPEMLAAHAAEYHAMATDARKAAEDTKPAVEQAAATMTSTRTTVEALESQIADLQQLLADARAGHEQAVSQHADALAVYAGHRADEQDAARTAEQVEQLAKEHRAAQAPEPPGEALVSTGLPVHVKAAPPEPAVHSAVPAPGGPPFNCQWCGQSVLREHGTWSHARSGEERCDPADELPFNVVQAPADVVAALTGGTPMIHDPDALASKAPLTTLTDPPAPDRPGPRHEKPKRSIDFSGAFKTITGRLTADEQPDKPNGDEQ